MTAAAPIAAAAGPEILSQKMSIIQLKHLILTSYDFKLYVGVFQFLKFTLSSETTCQEMGLDKRASPLPVLVQGVVVLPKNVVISSPNILMDNPCLLIQYLLTLTQKWIAKLRIE